MKGETNTASKEMKHLVNINIYWVADICQND